MSRSTPWKKRVRRLLSEPWTEAIIMTLVFVSVMLLPVEFGLHQDDPVQQLAELIGDALTWIFAVELSFRFWVAPRKIRFFQRYWPDILAVAPLIRPVRLFRVLRVLRLIRAGVLLNRRASWRGTTVEASAFRLMVLAALSGVLVLTSSVLLQRFESDTFSDPQVSIWYATLSLVAGEPIGGEPETMVGRTITLLLMLGGMTVFGLFIATVSATMMERMSKGILMSDIELDELEDHVIVCGWNGSGPTLLRELFEAERSQLRPVVLCTEKEIPKDLPKDVLDPRRFFYHKGDYTRIEVLQAIGAPQASTAILLTDNTIPRSDQDRDARTVLAALTMERMAPQLYTVAEVTSRQSEGLLSMAGVEEIVVGDWYAGVIMGSASRNRGLVGVLDEVLSHAYGNAFFTVKIPDHAATGTVGTLRARLHEQFEATLIALHRGEQRFVNPRHDMSIKRGDVIVILSQGEPAL